MRRRMWCLIFACVLGLTLTACSGGEKVSSQTAESETAVSGQTPVTLTTAAEPAEKRNPDGADAGRPAQTEAQRNETEISGGRESGETEPGGAGADENAAGGQGSGGAGTDENAAGGQGSGGAGADENAAGGQGSDGVVPDGNATDGQGADGGQPEETGGYVLVSEGMNGLTMAERPGVYRLQYDASIFDLDESEQTDSYRYIGDTAFPVYVAVQMFPDMTPEDVANGVLLQLGRDDAQTMETEIGAASIPARSVYLETEADGEVQIQLYHVISWGAGSIMIETGSSTDAGEWVDSSIETMMGTFELIG